jgi:hypothetical protein
MMVNQSLQSQWTVLEQLLLSLQRDLPRLLARMIQTSHPRQALPEKLTQRDHFRMLVLVHQSLPEQWVLERTHQTKSQPLATVLQQKWCGRCFVPTKPFFY